MLPIAALLLTACNARVDPAVPVLTGFVTTAATPSGLVALRDASTPREEVSTRTDAAGAFAIDARGLEPPFLLRTEVTEGATTSRLHAVWTGPVNLNPITEAVVVGAAAGADPDVLFAAPDPEPVRSVAGRARAVSAQLAAALAPLYRLYGVTDPVEDTSAACAAALRALLLDVSVVVAPNRDLVVTNRATAAVIYQGPTATPSAGTFVAANLPLGPLGGGATAFPGCEGSGCNTRGGFTSTAATPRIFRVTSLADGSGAGTLGACIAASGPRVCLFAVAGTIRTGGYAVANPYLTIDARSAPGGGVALSAEGTTPRLSEHDLVWIRTHDVVIRGLRMRAGWMDRKAHALGMWAASAGDDIHDIVLDHNSFSLGKDGNIDIYGGAGAPAAQAPRQMTLSYNVIAEALDMSDLLAATGSRGSLTGGGSATYADPVVDVDYHHNFFASNMYRNPLFTGKSGRWVNNVLFNWRWWGMQTTCGAAVDMIANLGKLGPAYTRGGYLGMYATDFGSSDCASGTTQTYLEGNQYAGDDAVYGWDSKIVSADSTATSATYRRAAPLPAPTSGPPIRAARADVASASVVGSLGAGASYRLDCGGRRVANRDSADVRVAETQWASLPSFSWTGRTTVASWGGYPAIGTITSTTTCASGGQDNASCTCADADGDGMPDLWETWACGSATACDPLAAYRGTAWTNLEAYLSGAAGVP